MVTYQVERYPDVIEEIKPLLHDHWEEIAGYKDQFPLNPDYEKYAKLDEMGMCHIVTARDEGIMIGYFVSFVMPHLHYQDCLYAMNDIVFVAKEHRHGSVGAKLIRFAEVELAKMGAHRMCLHVKVSNDFGPLLERMGFACTEKNYEKLLNRRC